MYYFAIIYVVELYSSHTWHDLFDLIKYVWHVIPDLATDKSQKGTNFNLSGIKAFNCIEAFEATLLHTHFRGLFIEYNLDIKVLRNMYYFHQHLNAWCGKFTTFEEFLFFYNNSLNFNWNIIENFTGCRCCFRREVFRIKIR